MVDKAEEMNEKVSPITVIVGAGAALDLDHSGVSPSVHNITQELLKLPVQKVNGEDRLLLNELYDFIIGGLQQIGNPDTRRFSHPDISFEEILHVLEMCLSYSSCWHDEYLQWESFPLFGALVDPKSFLKDIDTIEYLRAAYSLEEKVMEIVNQYDSTFRENKSSDEWYRCFWRSITGSNIFSLNYDSTIEQSLGLYEDGFEICGERDDYYRFSVKKYSENLDKKTTIAHLHGSILFSEPKAFPFEYSNRDLVKNKDYVTAYNNRQWAQSTPSTQAKEGYVQPYIISGSRKTEKMVCAPYNVYLSDITRKVLENKRLMIIGYSFNDLYLNEILGLGIAAHGDDFRVVIIDKFPASINGYSSLFQHLQKRSGMFTFVSRLVKERLYIEPGQTAFPLVVKDYDTPVVSQNEVLMMCTGGFKDAVEKHNHAIRRHLRI